MFIILIYYKEKTERIVRKIRKKKNKIEINIRIRIWVFSIKKLQKIVCLEQVIFLEKVNPIIDFDHCFFPLSTLFWLNYQVHWKNLIQLWESLILFHKLFFIFNLDNLLYFHLYVLLKAFFLNFYEWSFYLSH